MKEEVVHLHQQVRRSMQQQAMATATLNSETTVPVLLRFGKVLRTFTVHVRTHSDVVVDRLSGDVAGTRGAGSRSGRSSSGGDCRHAGTR
jgi:hypothetical protein